MMPALVFLEVQEVVVDMLVVEVVQVTHPQQHLHKVMLVVTEPVVLITLVVVVVELLLLVKMVPMQALVAPTVETD